MVNRIRFFDSRQLAARLAVNPARWKRWVRTFLPADPLSGLQSGYARQFYAQDAFRVYLGGHLMGELGYSADQARCILSDLDPWMAAAGLRFDARGQYSGAGEPSSGPRPLRHEVVVTAAAGGLRYLVRAVLSETPPPGQGAGTCRLTRAVVEERFASAGVDSDHRGPASGRVIDLTGLAAAFADRMGLGR